MTREERDAMIEASEKAIVALTKALAQERNKSKELRSMTFEPEIDIQRWRYNPSTGSAMVEDARGKYCLYSDVKDLVAKLTKPAPYEKDKVFWSNKHKKVFRLTGELAKDDDWHLGYDLCRDHAGEGYPKAEIIDTPVYEYNGDRYIWDGGAGKRRFVFDSREAGSYL